MAANHEDVSILALAEAVLEQTKAITKYLQANSIAAPTFSSTASVPPNTPEYLALQSKVRESLEDLQRLIEGPTKFYRSFFMGVYELAAFQIALDFDFFTLVPTEGEIALEELAAKAVLDQDRTSRVVRLLITQRFFQERRPGYISHNLFSVALQDEELRSLVHYSFDEMLKAAADSTVSLKATPYESDSDHCPFNTRHKVPIFQYYAQNPDKAGRFARAMAGYRRMENSINELRDNFPWGQLQGTVVDIGGGSGHVAMILARLFPQLDFVVQDGSTHMLAEGQKLLAEEIRERITFRQHNFFEPQPVRGAAAFLLRQCTHNWADADVVTIFKAVVTGLEGSAPETPLLINDVILPESGTISRQKEREMRQADMVMLVSFGAKQRTQKEFGTLLKEADPRYEIRRVHETGALGLLEVYLKR
ncbi:O-methyltransferase-domain-containing protein [Aspergillus alliaceus]|uniref:O-methyltransferase-domain-containing protein n=1 Tax=Petromyces alliaceus TaxID=209559 RepID=UPI0012A6760B|nr:O-methyltransferase-domain-containing protein [Aspergillus alliaceus]KAB8235180.1 O-methyltransferase-domain-containing protein [Aspergillus alliaceus]